MDVKKNFESDKVEWVFNFHLLEECNYSCFYCFAKYGCVHMLTFEDAKHVVDGLAEFYYENGIGRGQRRINLAGGEPLLCPYLDELISYILGYGIKVSIITNGSLLDERKIDSWTGKLSTIGISVDSVDGDALGRLGECDRWGNTLTEKKLISLANAVHAAGIRLKINIVVTKLNLGRTEELCRLMREIRPDRVKILRMQIVKDVNETAQRLAVTEEEYEKFCAGIKCEGADIVSEGSEDIQNAYLMIDPEGTFYMNVGGCHRKIGNLLTEDAVAVVDRAMPYFSVEKYKGRYKNVPSSETWEAGK